MAIDITNAAEYQECINQINLWYGKDAQKIINIANQYELSPSQLTEDWLSGSGFEPWYTSEFGIRGYNSAGTASINSASQFQQAVNSNAGSTTLTALKTPVETTVNQAGKVEVSSGLTSVATGAKSALTFVSKEVLPAISAAGLGISLGKAIDSALYNANPDFWDNAGMSSLNPETWNSITSDYPDGFLKKAFNTIFGLNPETGETQMYLDSDAAAYLAQYMQEQGVFSTGEHNVPSIPDGFPNVPDIPIPFNIAPSNNTMIDVSGVSRQIIATPITPYAVFFKSNSQANKIYWVQYSDSQISGLNQQYTFNNKTVYFAGGSYTWIRNFIDQPNLNNVTVDITNSFDKVAWLAQYNSQQSSPVAGITDQTGATTPDFSGCTTPQDYKNALENQFPELAQNAVTQSVVDPTTGNTTVIKYYPIGTPSSGNTNTQPVTTGDNSGNTQTNQSANPDTLDLTGLQNLINQLTETISKTGTPDTPDNPDPTGSGNTPPIVPPTGSASALWSVYNPSQAQLNSFGAWLWSSNFIDQILKLFNNPMQSIIGVHKVFASPSISGAGSIRVGYLDSGVSANIVGAQYTTIDCGSVRVSEQFGNVFDYNDTNVRLYLPFIGIVPLDVMDVMRGTVRVIYHVDVITGACLAEVKVTRDGGGGTLYQYSGDAAVRYPISSGSYMGVVSGVLGVVGGIASGIMSGGATLPMTAGAIASGVGNAKTQVQHSGSFAGNAGAMGAKIPYLIIERPQTAIAKGYTRYQGKGNNTVTTVSDISGYFKMTDVRTDSITGVANSEIEAIRSAIEQGVIK